MMVSVELCYNGSPPLCAPQSSFAIMVHLPCALLKPVGPGGTWGHFVCNDCLRKNWKSVDFIKWYIWARFYLQRLRSAPLQQHTFTRQSDNERCRRNTILFWGPIGFGMDRTCTCTCTTKQHETCPKKDKYRHGNKFKLCKFDLDLWPQSQ